MEPMGERMDSTQPLMEEDPQEMEKALPAPEEQLTRKDPQTWALWCGVAALMMSSWATRSPISCADPPEVDFTQCTNIVGDASGLHLPAFCRTGCMRRHSLFLLGIIAIGVLAQCVVVILNYGEFNNFFRLSWYFDLYDALESVQEKRKELQQGRKEEEKSNNGFLARGVRLVRRPLEAKLDKEVLNALHMGEQFNKRQVQRVTSAKGAIQLSVCCYQLATLLLMRVMYTSFSTVPAVFRCHGLDEKVEVPVKTRWGVLFGMGASVSLLLLAAFLEANATWAIHVKVFPKDRDKEPHEKTSDDDDGKVSADKRLRDHFRSYDENGRKLWFPKMKFNFPEEDFLLLKCVAGKKLVGVRYKGVLYSRNAVGNALDKVMDGTIKVPKKANEEVVLLFKDRKSKNMMAKVKELTGRNPHRAFAMLVLGFACMALFMASSSCWTCVEAINVREDRKMPVFELHERLLLMAACGRHASIGNASMLAGFAVAIALFGQALILLFSKERDDQEDENSYKRRSTNDDQMVIPLLDFRRNGDLSIAEYEEGSSNEVVTEEDEDEEEADVMCYVWASPKEPAEGESRNSKGEKKRKDADEEDDEEILDCKHRLLSTKFNKPQDVSMGKQWQASKRAMKVRLLRLSRSRRERMLNVAPRSTQYSVPSVAIEILQKDGSKRPRGSTITTYSVDNNNSEREASTDPSGFQQMVPAEFIAGSFHASVNLGPFQAWEKISAALAFAAALLAALDVTFFFFLDGGGLLSSCMDILTETTCVNFHVDVSKHKAVYHDKGEGLEFRASVGPFVALAGGSSALLAVLALRVANDPERRTRCCCLSSYCIALVYSIGVFCDLLKWIIMSIPAFFRNCWASCSA